MAVDVPVGWNTCSLKTPGVWCPAEEATWGESTENTVHCACWHESDYGDEPCCWCGVAGRWEGLAARDCIDCNNPFVHRQGDSQTMVCPSCQDRAAAAQRDHQIREAAHELLEAAELAAHYFGPPRHGPPDCAEDEVARSLQGAIRKARGSDPT